ncbi:40202_t:CDS:2 [Gigaspora margarita]|uniref:40202_t:CDS:1 n=1 Tax=Gigaspora margarita TaxID=4874 RepID=A0ABN7VPJ6_GIGMA|nr:40202_t:CDS:2 [Gigaspora margarita]
MDNDIPRDIQKQLKPRKMDKKADKRVYRTFQIFLILHYFEMVGEDSRTTPLLTNSNNNHMGRNSSPLDNLHNKNGVLQGNGASTPEGISFQDDDCIGGQNNNNEYEKFALPNDSQCNVEGESYTNITMVPFECCPNQERIRSLQLSLEQLRRISILTGNAWTKEESKTLCRVVVPNVQYNEARIPETISHVPKGEEQDEPREGCNSEKFPLMIVEMITYKSDHKRVANSLNYKLQGGDLPNCICYMEHVKEYYGFDHIIIIGELHTVILFLDCYGSVFIWESMCYILWMLGDYWNEATKTGGQKK